MSVHTVVLLRMYIHQVYGEGGGTESMNSTTQQMEGRRVISAQIGGG